MDDFTIKHVGEGKYEAEIDGVLRQLGPSFRDMIKYTYFEDITIPPDGWEVKDSKLKSDYFPKVMKDIKDGKVYPKQVITVEYE